MGNLNKSIEYLKKFLDQTTQSQTVNSQYGKICGCLASIYNSLVSNLKLNNKENE